MKKYLSLTNYVNFFNRVIIAPFAKGIEKKIYNELWAQSEKEPEKCPVFIIGVPRSGTTIGYQLLTSKLDVGYISNYVEQHYYAPLTAFKSFLQHCPERHDFFESEFGSVDRNYRWAPNQGVNFLYNWMPSLDHVHKLSDFSDSQLEDLRKLIHALLLLAKKNVLFKELSLSQKIPVLSELFPTAKFIVIDRDPVEVACSIFGAMEKQKIPEGVMWGAQFDGYEKTLFLPKKEMIAQQILGLKNGMEKGLKSVGTENVITFDYKDICQNPAMFVQKCSLFLGSELDNNLSKIKDEIRRKTGVDPLYQEFKYLLN